MNPPPNGSRGPNPSVLRVWSQQERQIWLASHRAPPQMRLITVAELAVMIDQLKKGDVLNEHFRQTAEALNAHGYWMDYPDVLTAANAAAFDARKMSRAADKAEHAIANALQAYELLAPRLPDFAGRADALAFRAELAEALQFIREQREAKSPAPDVPPPPAAPEQPNQEKKP